MCLSVPAKIIKIEGDYAQVTIGGTEYKASLQLLEEDVEIGDYILLHTGFAIQRLSEEEAEENFRLLREIGEAGDNV
ncbi:HypC/HybG/HupF family hydrogenase formation chaperone [candidate division KSB1 bacterium]